MTINISDFQVVEKAISKYADEAYTTARRLNGTAMVGSDDSIRTDGESFIGQLRWYKTITPNWNVPSFTDETDSTFTDITTEIATYIKSFHAIAAQQHNLQELITKEDGLEKFARDQVQLRADRESDAILSVLKGIAGAETKTGITSGITTYDELPSSTKGFFVDVNAAGVFGAAATGTSDARKLFDSTEMGAARGERLFQAIGMGYKDREPDYMYLLTSPELLADMRAANLVDQTKVTDGNLEFQTIFDGKFRLHLTRSAQGNFATAAGVNDQSTKTTFAVLPGSVIFKAIEAQVPFEIDRSPLKYRGAGTTAIVNRFGFIAHPKGYSWGGLTDRWADNTALAVGASWERKLDPLNLGVLPIFHS